MGMAKILSILQDEIPYRYFCEDDRGRQITIQATTFNDFKVGQWYHVADIDNTYNANNQRLVFDVAPKNVWRFPGEMPDNYGAPMLLAFLLDKQYKEFVPGFRFDTVIDIKPDWLILQTYGWAKTICIPESFKVRDRVVVMFTNHDFALPFCVGWRDKPRECDTCFRPDIVEIVPQWIRIDKKTLNPFPGWEVTTTSTSEDVPNLLNPTIGRKASDVSTTNTAPLHAGALRFRDGGRTYYEITMGFKVGEKCVLKNVKKISRRDTIDLQKSDRSDEIIIWERGVSPTKEPPEEFEVSNVVPIETYTALIADPTSKPTAGNPLQWDNTVTAFQTHPVTGWPKDKCNVEGESETVTMQVPLSWDEDPAIPNKITTKPWLPITDNNIDVRIELNNGSTHDVSLSFFREDDTTTSYPFARVDFEVEVASGASFWIPLVSCLPYTYDVPRTELRFGTAFAPDTGLKVTGSTADHFVKGEETHDILSFETTVDDPKIKIERIYSDDDLTTLRNMGVNTIGLQSWTLEFDTNLIGEKQLAKIVKVK